MCSTRQEEGTDHLARLLTNTVSRLEALSLRYHNVGYAASSFPPQPQPQPPLPRPRPSPLYPGPSTSATHLTPIKTFYRDHGARLMATTLASHAYLTHLDLERNHINTSG